MGYTEIACVLEECGRTLVPEPVLSTALLGANAVLLVGREEQKQTLLPGIADGSTLLALAYHERGSRFEPTRIATRATRRGSSYTIDGCKSLVIDGHAADVLIVAARTGGEGASADGISFFTLRPGTPGLRVTRQSVMDLRNVALVELNAVEVGEDTLLGDEGRAVI